MNAQELLTLSANEFTVRTLGMSREEINYLVYPAKFEFMSFVKNYLKENKCILHSLGPDDPHPYFKFTDEIYGDITLSFIGYKNRKYFRYYVTSEKLSYISPMLRMFPATLNTVASGIFTVNYESEGVIKHYYIKVK